MKGGVDAEVYMSLLRSRLSQNGEAEQVTS